jgi:hypothetical protein
VASVEVVQLLIEAGANVNAQDNVSVIWLSYNPGADFQDRLLGRLSMQLAVPKLRWRSCGCYWPVEQIQPLRTRYEPVLLVLLDAAMMTKRPFTIRSGHTDLLLRLEQTEEKTPVDYETRPDVQALLRYSMRVAALTPPH